MFATWWVTWTQNSYFHPININWPCHTQYWATNCNFKSPFGQPETANLVSLVHFFHPGQSGLWSWGQLQKCSSNLGAYSSHLGLHDLEVTKVGETGTFQPSFEKVWVLLLSKFICSPIEIFYILSNHCYLSAICTVGQREKVTAVTFLPHGRGWIKRHK